MPRDSTDTKARLLREAEHLFATRGVYQVTVREITTAAGQRNVSAINYHFGSRDGLLREILLRHGEPTDRERGRLLADVGADVSTRDLVMCLLLPMTAHFATDAGRDYLRIVAQLTGRFAVWREEDDLSPPYLRRILGLIEERPAHVTTAVRRERVVGVIMLMTTALAERARQLASQRRVRLAEPVFVANLADMIVGALDAPSGPLPGRSQPLARQPTRPSGDRP